MSDSGKVLVAGLGSPHGDDQAGWFVAEQLLKKMSGTLVASEEQDKNLMSESSRHLFPHVVVRRAMIPLDVLDWLEGVSILHVCDAFEATQRHGKLHRFIWDAGQLVDSDRPHALGIGSFNRVPSEPREQRPPGWIPTRGALPTRLNTCDILNLARYKSADSDVNAALKWRRGRGSHDFGLPDVLRLAENTGLLPEHVIIWAIAGTCFQPEDVMRDATRIAALQTTNEIYRELKLFDA